MTVVRAIQIARDRALESFEGGVRPHTERLEVLSRP
jgi:hypothetical protein